jgi:Uncharacterised nucleotidyltransferase
MSELAGEARLVRAVVAASSGHSSAPGPPSRGPRDGLDLRYLYTLAVAHGVVPLVHSRLASTGELGVPAGREGRLFSQHVQVGALRSAYLEQRLREVLASLAGAGVRALAYKGPALARLAYGDLALRGFGDLDLLCHADDVVSAVEALTELGYRGAPYLEAWRLRRALPIDCQYALERADGEVRVEIHWGVVRPPFGSRPEFDGLWERRVEVPAAGFRMDSPSPTDLFVLLAVHGHKHRWSRLGWIADLARLARLVEGDGDAGWDRVEEGAAGLGFGIEVWLARELLRRLAGGERLERPPPVARRLERLADTVERSFFPPRGEPGAAARLRFHLAGRESFLARLRHLAALAWTPALDDLASPRLPAALFPLYRPLRPLLLLRKRGRAEH